MAKHKKNAKVFEHSKIITTGVLCLSVVVVLFTLFMVWRTYDLTPLTVLIPSVEAAFCITAKHYYAKAALENQIKLKKIYGDLVEVNKNSPPIVDEELWGNN